MFVIKKVDNQSLKIKKNCAMACHDVIARSV